MALMTFKKCGGMISVKFIKRLIPSVIAVTAVTGAYAQLYGELTYMSAKGKYSGANFTSEASPEMINAYIGYGVHENLAAEGLLGTGLGGTDVKVNGASQRDPVTSKADYSYGFFIKPRIKLNDDVELFSRLGYLKGKITSSTVQHHRLIQEVTGHMG